MDGEAMNRLSDWLWSMYGWRAAASSMIAFCGTSHAVRNNRRISSGSAARFCTEPSSRLMAVRVSSVHNPSFFNARTRAALICRNSPDSVSRLNTLDTCGSMHS